jgi:hypothetical protein
VRSEDEASAAAVRPLRCLPYSRRLIRLLEHVIVVLPIAGNRAKMTGVATQPSGVNPKVDSCSQFELPAPFAPTRVLPLPSSNFTRCSAMVNTLGRFVAIDQVLPAMNSLRPKAPPSVFNHLPELLADLQFRRPPLGGRRSPNWCKLAATQESKMEIPGNGRASTCPLEKPLYRGHNRPLLTIA